MKVQTKRRGRILSARKSIIEQTKMRQGFERRLYKQMVSYFNSTGRQASREIQSGRVELKGLEERLSQVLLPHYRSVIESFANRFVFTKQENQWERIIRNYITTQGGAKITRISGTTRTKINKIISDGQVEGFGVDKIAKNIRTQMSEPFTRYRSALIARTETHNASSYTNQAVAESYEVPMKKRWVSTNDDRTRSHHSAMNGVEVDIEADFDVPYKGVTYKMKHAGDPRGGPANVINCRCVILYVEPDDFVIDEDTPQDQQLPTVSEPPVSDSTGIFKVVNRDSVTETSVKLLSTKEATKQLNKIFGDASKDDRYLAKNINHFRGRNPDKDFGKVSGAKLTDRDLSMIVALIPEAQELCKKFDVPMLRGIKGSANTTQFNADMGDGVMGIAQFFARNGSRNVGESIETISDKNREKLELALAQKGEFIEKRKERIRELLRGTENGTYEELGKYDQAVFDSQNKALLVAFDEYNDIKAKLKSKSLSQDYLEANTWKRGDDISKRPHSIKSWETNYFDQFRSVWYHEIGHHIHQLYKRKIKDGVELNNREPNFLQVEKPLENRLDKVTNINATSPTGYGTTNTKEWFVENFSLYYRGKQDLVAPEFLEILQEIKDGKIN